MDAPVVRFYLDFVSPYTWLALMQAERFAEQNGIRWEPYPVVYAALLEAHGLVGPVETPAKRRYTFEDVARSAHRLGLKFAGPPEHPFRSLEALRALTVFGGELRALLLAVRLSDACWGEGKSLADVRVIGDVVRSVGLDANDLEARLAGNETKQALRAQTDEATRIGVFGVPTFVWDGELFWGHDRMDLLASRLAGRTPPARDLVGTILDRPRGVDRAAKRPPPS